MSDKGEKTCPLCAEEMDLTDQQLKPCKCGYEICVWCWNQIMEMAEKDNAEGLCPACRTAYDKERIVGMAANCERLVAEMSSERKQKSQKVKPKTSEGRMHLSNVRVIQRNLVYIMGLPLDLADEAVLQRREYFGQYGKVLKVSISRTATGAIQHSSNNCCCVYITYAKEEEAIRCIQSVHCFVLEGRPLRACFGTTKYCHAWLRNMPCSIPDCFYLHDFGSEEDSFTKDDLVSAFTRSKDQQIIGATNNMHRRAGNVLPSPGDLNANRNLSSLAKIDPKSSSNRNIENWGSGSCAESGTGRSNALPGAASWVMRVSASLPQAKSTSSSGGTPSHMPEASYGPQVLVSEVASTKRPGSVESIPERSSEVHPSYISSNDAGYATILPDGTSSMEPKKTSCVPTLYEDENYKAEGNFQALCSGLSLISIDSDLKDDSSCPATSGTSISNQDLSACQDSEEEMSDLYNKASALPVPRRSMIMPIKHNEITPPLTCGDPLFSNGFYDNKAKANCELDTTSSNENVLSELGIRRYMDDHENNAASDGAGILDTGESSIISDILSMDWNTWEDSLISPQGLSKLLTESDIHQGPLKVPSLPKIRDSSQSRFSFARQDDDFFNRGPGLNDDVRKTTNQSSASHFITERNGLRTYKNQNAGSFESNGFLDQQPLTSSKFSDSLPFAAAPRTPTSPPPGFSVLSKAIPPGFPAHGTVPYSFDQSANDMPLNSAHPFRSIGGYEIGEYPGSALTQVDRQILSGCLDNSGIDWRPAVSPKLNSFNRDTELQSLMQHAIPLLQTSDYPDYLRSGIPSPSDSYSIGIPSPSDSYSISRMLLGQTPASNPSAFSQVGTHQLTNLKVSNGHWDGWNEVRNVSDLGMSHQGLGLHKFSPSYEDIKCQVPSSNNIYNRRFAL